MLDLVVRNGVIALITLFLYTILENVPYLKLTKSMVVLPFLITLAPVLFGMLPIMGTRDMMKGRMPQFISSMIFGLLAILYPMLMKTMDVNVEEKITKNGMEINVNVIIILGLIVFTEIMIQIQYEKFMMKNNNNNIKMK